MVHCGQNDPYFTGKTSFCRAITRSQSSAWCRFSGGVASKYSRTVFRNQCSSDITHLALDSVRPRRADSAAEPGTRTRPRRASALVTAGTPPPRAAPCSTGRRRLPGAPRSARGRSRTPSRSRPRSRTAPGTSARSSRRSACSRTRCRGSRSPRSRGWGRASVLLAVAALLDLEDDPPELPAQRVRHLVGEDVLGVRVQVLLEQPEDRRALLLCGIAHGVPSTPCSTSQTPAS